MTAPTAPTCEYRGETTAPTYRHHSFDCIRHLAAQNRELADRVAECEALLRGYNAVDKALAGRVAAIEAHPALSVPAIERGSSPLKWTKPTECRSFCVMRGPRFFGHWGDCRPATPAPASAEPPRKLADGWMWTGDMETLECVHCGERAAVKDTRQFPPHGVCQACMAVRDVFEQPPTVEAPRCKSCGDTGVEMVDGEPVRHCLHSATTAPSTNADHAGCNLFGDACSSMCPGTPAPEPPRADGQGTAEPVSHVEAKKCASQMTRDDYRQTIFRYIREREARDKAQTEVIRAQRERIIELTRLSPAPVEATGSNRDRACKFSRCSVQYGDASHDLDCDELAALLDNVARDAAARALDGIPEVKAWRALGAKAQGLVREDLTRSVTGTNSKYEIAARALASVAGSGK